MSYDAARAVIARRDGFAADKAFDALAAIGRHGAFVDRHDARDLVIRALDRWDEFPADARGLLQALVREYGLFPYLSDVVGLPLADRLAYEAHRPVGWTFREDLVFHSEQAMVYERLLDGQNVVLSAPTSFGKSLVIDAVLAARDFSNAAVIVPTLALMDETRRRLAHLRDRYKIITHGTQDRGQRNLWVMTQERMLEMGVPSELDFFVVDEFYKLDPSHSDERSAQLNILLWRLLETGAQFYLLGPNITAMTGASLERLRATFVSTGFSTVATDIERIHSRKETLPDDLAAACREVGPGTLIFCSSPKRTRVVANWLLHRGVGGGRDVGYAADWIADTYHPEWTVPRAVRHGIGIHHGRLPRALGHHMVRLFDEGRLPYLIVTSTLIEGVNTAAKNVVILDNKIANKKYDYFTFSNIRGRSGRMLRHFVGRVIVFNPAPSAADLEVDVPVLSQSEEASPEVLIQLPEEELSPASRERLRPYVQQRVVSVETLRKNKGVSLERQLDVGRELDSDPARWARVLSWRTPMPEASDVRAASHLLFKLTGAGPAVKTPDQLGGRLNILRRNRGDTQALIENQISRFGSEPDEAVEDTLDFLRNWAQFKIPAALTTLGSIASDVLRRSGMPSSDTSVFAGQVENLFLSPFASVLEEYGIPVPLTMKIEASLGIRSATSLDDILDRLRSMRAPADLTPFELEMFEEARAGL
ncbi:DEAD/DEAH box helicase [Jiangella mangrovi]|uniref:DEAD/DEAH box helicase n=1 Tax=Jiangella mangrovi TaxID=1524084 RepID=A0A7W9GRN9_9ACTN|nr:DEAD/DEAH box helicase [Jiangella mangrovi]MBB5788805.1 hypothetical protein [Jiangella mangrovi]